MPLFSSNFMVLMLYYYLVSRCKGKEFTRQAHKDVVNIEDFNITVAG